MRFFRGKIERPPVIIRRGRSYHPRDSTHQKIVIFQATTHNKALVTWKLLSPRGTKCHDFKQLLHQKHSSLGAGTYRNFFELTCKTETTIKTGFFLTSLGDTGGETTPRRLSFFLEFWVFPLSFEFFP